MEFFLATNNNGNRKPETGNRKPEKGERRTVSVFLHRVPVGTE
ncbi:MAG TPA: hypothetical protein VJ991_00270 [Balneolales bacterium]|nr:hypothetical protein [Balneolales bacterium]